MLKNHLPNRIVAQQVPRGLSQPTRDAAGIRASWFWCKVASLVDVSRQEVDSGPESSTVRC